MIGIGLGFGFGFGFGFVFAFGFGLGSVTQGAQRCKGERYRFTSYVSRLALTLTVEAPQIITS